MPRRLHLSDDDRQSVVEVSGYDVVIMDPKQSFVVRPEPEGRFRVHGGQVSTVGAAAVSGSVVWVSIDGAVFEIHVNADARRRAVSGQDALSSPMPATVVRIAVTPGQHVTPGDLLVALEAMKMELPIRAPYDGFVRAIHCREGEIVQPAVVLVEVVASVDREP